MTINENGVQVERQYIGARYVPKFFQGTGGSPEWVGGIAYEALTIVTYLGNSFTSKIPVPAGVGNPANNPTYWVNTGNYNAQVDEYRQEVATVKNDVVSLENTLNTEIQNRENAVNDIVQKITTNALYIGNSYTRGEGSSTSKGLFELTKNFFDEAIFPVSPNTSPIGFVSTDPNRNTFKEELMNWLANTSTEQKNKITHVIVNSAMGESRALKANNGSAVKAAISSFINTVKTNLPKAEIIIGLFDILSENNKGGITIYDSWDSHNMFTHLSCIYDFKYIGWFGWPITLQNPGYLSSDGYHPSDKGYNILANNWFSGMTGNYHYIVKRLNLFNDLGNRFLIYGYIDKTVIMPQNIIVSQPMTPDTVLIDFSKTTIMPFYGWSDSVLVANMAFYYSNNIAVSENSLEENGAKLVIKKYPNESLAPQTKYVGGPIVLTHSSAYNWL